MKSKGLARSISCLAVLALAVLALPGNGEAAVGGVNAGRGGGGVTVPSSGPVVDSNATASSTTPAEAEVTGRVRRADGSPAAAIKVLFEQLNSGQVVKEISGTTDSGGNYSIMLPGGVWRGMPCGSAMGWMPVYWEITSAGGEITDFRELRRDAPVLTAADVAVSSDLGVIRAGDPVTVTGIGFGCSGRIVVEVDGLDPVDVASFSARADDTLRFSFPAMPALADGSHVIVRKARFTYVQGPARSNTVTFASPVENLHLFRGERTGQTGNGKPLPQGFNRRDTK